MRAHRQQGYDVFPVNPNVDEVEGVRAYPRLADVPVAHLDRISVYVPPNVGLKLLDEIKAKGAAEVWFNPGAESPAIIRRAEELGLEIIQACSIVDVGMSPRELPDA